MRLRQLAGALKRAAYANTAATLAVFIVLAGGTAYATSHYLITKVGQFSASVRTALQGTTGPTGVSGATGATGSTGPANQSATTVDGQTVTKIFYQVPDNTASAQLYSQDGLTLDASCSSSGAPGLTATSSDPNAELNWGGDNDGVLGNTTITASNNDGVSGTKTILSSGTNNRGSMILAYANTSDQVVTITFGFDYRPSFGSFSGCGIWATAVSTS
jgi:hypothetical protein